MTNREFIAAFHEIMAGRKYFGRDQAVLLADRAGIKPDQAVTHCENLALLDHGSLDFIVRAAGPFTDQFIEEARLRHAKTEID